jgi:predicted DCC family thiol-disulfide oxidoreductase YuxK
MGPTFEQFMMCYVFWVPWASVAAKLRERTTTGAVRLVVFDGGCGFCTRTVAVLRRLDLLGRLRFADANVSGASLASIHPSLTAEACLADMHVVVGHESGTVSIKTGFDGYRSIAWVLPLAWPTLPVLYVPGVPWAGRRVYRLVAFHRATSSCSLPERALQEELHRIAAR